MAMATAFAVAIFARSKLAGIKSGIRMNRYIGALTFTGGVPQ